MSYVMKRLSAFFFFVISASAVSAATVWVPTSQDVDTVSISFFPAVELDPDAAFGVFDTSGAVAPELVLAPVDQIGFTQLVNSTWEIANVAGETGNLGLTNAFLLAYNPDTSMLNNWQFDIGASFLGGDSWSLIFPDLYGTLYIATDVKVSTMPVPPALLLFGSGLVGLGILSRRRRRKQTLAAAPA